MIFNRIMKFRSNLSAFQLTVCKMKNETSFLRGLCRISVHAPADKFVLVQDCLKEER